MSSKLRAIELLSQWIEMGSSGLAGTTVDAKENTAAVRLIRRELLLNDPYIAKSVNCPECCDDHAKVRGKLSLATYRGFCDSCGSVELPTAYVERYLVNLSRVVGYIGTGLGLKGRPQEIVPQQVWLLGKTAAKGKIHFWYFGCRLDEENVADQLRTSIEKAKASNSSTVITTSRADKLQRTPIRDLVLAPLDAVALLGAFRFEFDQDKLDPIAPEIIEDTNPGTTLRYVDDGLVFVDDVRFDLEPRQQKILQALIAHPDHEVSLQGLRNAAGTQSQSFSPAREFGRNKVAYKKFIEYLVDDKVYHLIVPEGDFGFL